MTRPSNLLAARSVGRALAEIAIIVVGVLIALGADSWRQSREQAVLREEYRAALLDDLVADSLWYGYTLDTGWIPESVEATDSLRDAMFDGATRSEDQVALWLSRTLRLVAGGQRRGAYDELVSTGRLALFEDPSLRQEIVRYYQVDLRVDPDVYAIFVERTFFPWQDVLRHVGGVGWYEELTRCTAAFDVRNPGLVPEFEACVAALPDVGILDRLRESDEAISRLQDMILVRAFRDQGLGMQSLRRCLSAWLSTGQRVPEACDDSGRVL